MLFDELDEFDVHEGLGRFGQVAKHQAGCAEEDGVGVLADGAVSIPLSTILLTVLLLVNSRLKRLRIESNE